MSAPVDVLAVLAFAIGKEGSRPPPTPMHFDEALAAVVELVEAARDSLEVGFNVAPSPTRGRLRAALAKFGGAA